MKEEKTRMKFLIINDIHNRIQNVRKVISKVKSEKFDYVLCCGNIITLPTGDNADKNRIESLIPVMKSIFLEIENIAPIIWVPGNHDAYSFLLIILKKYLQKAKIFTKNLKKLQIIYI